MLQNWIQHLTMHNSSGFSMTFSSALRIRLQDVLRLPARRLLRDGTNPRRLAWTGETVLHAQRQVFTEKIGRQSTSGVQIASCNACTE